MASAVGLQSEHTVHIDRSKETDSFYRFYEQTQKKIKKMITAIVKCRFQFYAYFLYLDYERVLSVYSIKLVTKRLKMYRFSRKLVYVIMCIHSFRMALSYGRLGAATGGSNPPTPHYHLFIHSVHLPDNLFISFYLFIYLFTYLFINLFIEFYLFIYS